MNLCEQEVNVPDEFSVMTPVVIDHQSDCHRLTVDLKKKRVFVTTSSAGMMSDTHTQQCIITSQVAAVKSFVQTKSSDVLFQ